MTTNVLLTISNGILELYNNDTISNDTKQIIADITHELSDLVHYSVMEDLNKDDFKDKVLDILKAFNAKFTY